MRILFVTWNYPPKVGGMEMMLSQLVHNLRSHADMHVLGPFAKQGYKEREGEQVMRPKREGLIWFTFYALFQGVRSLRTTAYDAIIAGSALVTPIVYILGRLFGLPIMVDVYGLDLTHPHPLYQWMVRSLLPRFDHVFAISQASREEALNQSVAPDQVSIMHPGLDFSEFEAVPDVDSVRRQYDLDGRLSLLSVGRLARRKGLIEFVRYSLPTIVDKRPETVLLIVGDNPIRSLAHKEDIKACIQAEVKTLGLEGHVRMLGWVERRVLVDLYRACDLFVLPAIEVPGDMEGFGIVLIEAGAAGRPVVSTRLGGITDAVEDGRSGVLVAAGMWDELADAILNLLENEPLRRRMGQFGRERVRAEFDWSVVSRRYAERLTGLLEAKH